MSTATLTGPRATVIADSITETGQRLTTMEATFHRYMLPEFNTHCVFARNSASSRARRVESVLADIEANPAFPLTWRTEQPGMQGGADLSPDDRAAAIEAWGQAMNAALSSVRDLAALGLHKSTTNRLVEPFAYHTVVVTSTSYENFFDLRIDDAAQDEIRAVAEAMRDARDASTPTLLTPGQWHTPYVTPDQVADLTAYATLHGLNPTELITSVSAARSAGVSYMTHAIRRALAADLKLFTRLCSNGHWSPLEHVATPWPENVQSQPLTFTGFDQRHHTVPVKHLPRVGKFAGWRPLRTQVEAIQAVTTWR